MNEEKVEKSIKLKKTFSIILIIISIISCTFLGYFSISFLQDYLTSDDTLYKLAMILVIVLFFAASLIALVSNIISLIIQKNLKDHRSIFQYVISFVTLFLNFAFIVLFFILLFVEK